MVRTLGFHPGKESSKLSGFTKIYNQQFIVGYPIEKTYNPIKLNKPYGSTFLLRNLWDHSSMVEQLAFNQLIKVRFLVVLPSFLPVLDSVVNPAVCKTVASASRFDS